MPLRSVALVLVCLIASPVWGAGARAQDAPPAAPPPAGGAPAAPTDSAMGATGGVSAADSLVRVTAGNAAGERWDLARCIATALERNGDVRGAAARTVQARGSALRAWSGVLPSVSTNVSYTQVRPDKNSALRGSVDLAPAVPPDTLLLAPESQYYSVGGAVDMNILSVPAYAEKRRQDLLQGSAESGEAETRNTVAFTVKQRYFELLKAARLADVSRESEKLARDEESRSEALLQVGTVARGDLLKARARRAQTQLDRISAENQVKVARSRLAQAMGLAPSTPLEVQEVLDENVPLPDSAASVAAALRNRPLLSQSARAERAARAGLFGARAERLPKLTGSLSVDRSRITDHLETDPTTIEIDDTHYATRWQGTVAVTLPLFDGLALEGNAKSARGSLLEAEAARRQQELDVTVEVQQAWLALHEAVQRIGVSKEGLASAEEDYKFSKGRYDLGAGTYLDLLNAEVNLEQARRSYVEALADARVSEADLERAIGERRY